LAHFPFPSRNRLTCGPPGRSPFPLHACLVTCMWGPVVGVIPSMARALRADEDRTPATSEAPVRTRHHANKWGPLLGLMDTCSYLCAHKHVGPSVSDAVFVRTTPTSPPWTPTWLRAFFDRVVKISAGLGNHHCTTPPSAPADYKIGYWSVKGAASPQSDGCVTSTEDWHLRTH
jgi:hypothetical protein